MVSNVSAGVVHGLQRLFPQIPANMYRRAAFRRLLTRTVGHALRTQWQKHGPPEAPAGLRPRSAEEVRAVAAMLCGWHRDGYAEAVREKPLEWAAE